MTRFILLSAAALALAACGAKRDLQYPEGTPPPKPAAAAAQPSFEDMMTPPPQAIPDRVTDPLRKSQDRPEDRFDLPPPG